MQSLSIKVFTDLNTGGTRREWLRGRGSSGLAELEASTRRRWLNCRYFARNCRIVVACTSQSNSDGSGGAGQSSSSSPSSFLSQRQTYALLKQQMEVAAKSEVTLYHISENLNSQINRILAFFVNDMDFVRYLSNEAYITVLGFLIWSLRLNVINNSHLYVCSDLQDYKEAARIRDSLRQFEEEEPALRLRRLIKEAVADERFEVFRFFVSM